MKNPSFTKSCLFAAAVSLVCVSLATNAGGQTTSPMLGEVAGDNVSVLGPSNVVAGSTPRAIAFGGGSTIVVLSGKARVEFAGGGELEICGPAKFTVLASGEALTVALSFGRVHVKFNASRPITIYTPLIVATPMAVENQPRDFTLGLANTGAMCVLAARGAVQVQHQLSGETLIVPQPSEVLLQGTTFGATPAVAGSCGCDFGEPSAQKSAPPTYVAAQRQTTPEMAPIKPPLHARTLAPRSESAISLPPQAPIPPQPTSTKAKAPSAPAPERSTASATPPAKQRVAKINLPPIGYDAKSAAAPAEPMSVATLLLAKAAEVQPEWIFHGIVAEPPRVVKHVRVPAARRPATKMAKKQKTKQKDTKKGFWTKFHDLFAGAPAKSDCVGAGCG
ncbi:MAG: hypothetical protein ACYDDI_05885 [Candidatus Acidiferrales bacterium]